MSIPKYQAGDTRRVKWVSSGEAPSSIYAAFLDYTGPGSYSAVASSTMTDSGNGHYWAALTVPNTPGFYVAETLATIAGLPYKRRLRFRAVLSEVD